LYGTHELTAGQLHVYGS